MKKILLFSILFTATKFLAAQTDADDDKNVVISKSTKEFKFVNSDLLSFLVRNPINKCGYCFTVLTFHVTCN